MKLYLHGLSQTDSIEQVKTALFNLRNVDSMNLDADKDLLELSCVDGETETFVLSKLKSILQLFAPNVHVEIIEGPKPQAPPNQKFSQANSSDVLFPKDNPSKHQSPNNKPLTEQELKDKEKKEKEKIEKKRQEIEQQQKEREKIQMQQLRLKKRREEQLLEKQKEAEEEAQKRKEFELRQHEIQKQKQIDYEFEQKEQTRKQEEDLLRAEQLAKQKAMELQQEELEKQQKELEAKQAELEAKQQTYSRGKYTPPPNDDRNKFKEPTESASSYSQESHASYTSADMFQTEHTEETEQHTANSSQSHTTDFEENISMSSEMSDILKKMQGASSENHTTESTNESTINPDSSDILKKMQEATLHTENNQSNEANQSNQIQEPQETPYQEPIQEPEPNQRKPNFFEQMQAKQNQEELELEQEFEQQQNFSEPIQQAESSFDSSFEAEYFQRETDWESPFAHYTERQQERFQEESSDETIPEDHTDHSFIGRMNFNQETAYQSFQNQSHQDDSDISQSDLLKKVDFSQIGNHEGNYFQSSEEPENILHKVKRKRKRKPLNFSVYAKTPKTLFLLFGFGLCMYFGGLSTIENPSLSNALFLSAYILFSYDVLFMGVRNVIRKNFFNEYLLILSASIGIIALNRLSDAVMIMMIYQLGEVIQKYAVKKTRQYVYKKLDIPSDYANRLNGTMVERIPSEEIEVGDIILVRPREYCPIDGIVIEGRSLVDTSTITGNGTPKLAKIGDEVLCGYVNLEHSLKLKITKSFSNCTMLKTVNIVKEAIRQPSSIQKTLYLFTRVYTPVIVLFAILLAGIPYYMELEPEVLVSWYEKALLFLIIAKPSSFLLSVPMTYFRGISIAARRGILMKDGNALDSLHYLKQIALDKTNTLTKGNFNISRVVAQEGRFPLFLAAIGENYKQHPLGEIILKVYHAQNTQPLPRATGYKEILGQGFSYYYQNERVIVGNARLMESEFIKFKEYEGVGTVVYVSKNSVYQGCIVLQDDIKTEMRPHLESFQSIGIGYIVLLTGDNRNVAERMQTHFPLDNAFYNLTPDEKLNMLNDLEFEDPKYQSAFLSNDLKDAIVLEGADLGIITTGLNSPLLVDVADVVFMDDNLNKLETAMKISHKTHSLIKENIIIAGVSKVLLLLAGTAGYITIPFAVLADVGVTIVTVCNALRNNDTKL